MRPIVNEGTVRGARARMATPASSAVRGNRTWLPSRISSGTASQRMGLSTSAASYARILGANDRVRVGVFGFSERFRDALLPAFQQHAANTNFEIVALSDIWSLRRADGIAGVVRLRATPARLVRARQVLAAHVGVALEAKSL